MRLEEAALNESAAVWIWRKSLLLQMLPNIRKIKGRNCSVSGRKKSFGGQCRARTCDLLLVSQLFTLPRTCRSDRKAGENQRPVISGDKLLTAFSSSFSRFCCDLSQLV